MNKLKRFTSVEELYNRKGEPTGEIIIDEVINAIRTTKTHKSEDIALLLDVDQRALWFAVQLLTGMRLNDIILHWRVLQAKEKWNANLALYQDDKERYRSKVSTVSLNEIASRYGWKSFRSLQRTARRFGIVFETLPYAVRKRK